MASSSGRQRKLLGVHVTVQVIAMLLAALVLSGLVGLAVLDWMERTA